MFESFPSPEYGNKSREDIVNALKTKGIEDGETKEALAKFIEASRLEVEKITDKALYHKASIECSINNAKLFYEAGYLQEAYDDLLDTYEIAYQVMEEGEINKINELLDEIGPKIGR